MHHRYNVTGVSNLDRCHFKSPSLKLDSRGKSFLSCVRIQWRIWGKNGESVEVNDLSDIIFRGDIDVVVYIKIGRRICDCWRNYFYTRRMEIGKFGLANLITMFCVLNKFYLISCIIPITSKEISGKSLRFF